MKTRKQALTVPDRPHYLRVEIEGRGEHAFRIPSMPVAVDMVTDARDAVDEQDAARRTTRMLYAGAAFVGETWWHPTEALETVKRKDVESYGREVYEELHEAGYKSSEILELVNRVGAAVRDSALMRDEVEARKDFSDAVPEPSSASDSASPESGAETSENGAA